MRERGISLIEVILSVAFASAIALNLAEIRSRMNTEVKKAEQILDESQLQSILTKLIDREDYCSCLLRNLILKPEFILSGKEQFIPSFPQNFEKPIPQYPSLCIPSSTNLIPKIDEKIPGTQIVIKHMDLVQLDSIGEGFYIARFRLKFFGNKRRKVEDFVFSSVLSIGKPGAIKNLPAPIDSCIASRSMPSFQEANSPHFVNAGPYAVCPTDAFQLLRLWPEQEVMLNDGSKCKITSQWLKDPPQCGGSSAKNWHKSLCESKW